MSDALTNARDGITLEESWGLADWWGAYAKGDIDATDSKRDRQISKLDESLLHACKDSGNPGRWPLLRALESAVRVSLRRLPSSIIQTLSGAIETRSGSDPEQFVLRAAGILARFSEFNRPNETGASSTHIEHTDATDEILVWRTSSGPSPAGIAPRARTQVTQETDPRDEPEPALEDPLTSAWRLADRIANAVDDLSREGFELAESEAIDETIEALGTAARDRARPGVLPLLRALEMGLRIDEVYATEHNFELVEKVCEPRIDDPHLREEYGLALREHGDRVQNFIWELQSIDDEPPTVTGLLD